MTRISLVGIALLAIVAMAGCTAPQPAAEPEQSEQPEQAEETQMIDYEFEPYATLETVTGWPATASSVAYFVSEPIEAECHWVEASSLIGPQIAAVVGMEPAALTGLACGMTATPASDRDDVVDEVAWRIDAGAGELVAAYAATAFDDGDLDCAAVDVPLGSPGLSVSYDDAWYVVRPGAVACPETVSRIESAMEALQLTEVLRHTTTFDDYIARGY